MLAFYGSRISEHLTRTPEGFLVCLNVPISRTGRQDYLPSEIGMDGDRMIPVYRTEEEVFSRAAMASFEGKPVTEEHPPMSVTSENYGMFHKGHAQNVHRGSGESQDLLLADLVIFDAELIRQIENGLREVSCGYECTYSKGDDGRIYQCEIRGNHIAVVAAGRAGARVSIKDQKPNAKGEKETMQSNKKASIFARMFTRWAQDADPEEVAEAVDAMVEEDPKTEPQAQPKDADPAADPAAPPTGASAAPQKDSDGEVLMLLRQILSKLGGNTDAEPTDPVQQLVNELEGKAAEQTGKTAQPVSEDEEESVTVPAEEITDESKELTGENPIPGTDSAAALAAIKAIKPFLAKLNEKDRIAAGDSISKAVRQAMGRQSKPANDGYAAIVMQQRQAAKKRTGDSNTAVKDADLGAKIMAKRNPHYMEK